jgi:hypothetical protein
MNKSDDYKKNENKITKKSEKGSPNLRKLDSVFGSASSSFMKNLKSLRKNSKLIKLQDRSPVSNVGMGYSSRGNKSKIINSQKALSTDLRMSKSSASARGSSKSSMNNAYGSKN